MMEKEMRFKCQIMADIYESYRLTRPRHIAGSRRVYTETAVKGYILTGYVLLAVSSGDESIVCPCKSGHNLINWS